MIPPWRCCEVFHRKGEPITISRHGSWWHGSSVEPGMSTMREEKRDGPSTVDPPFRHIFKGPDFYLFRADKTLRDLIN